MLNRVEPLRTSQETGHRSSPAAICAVALTCLLLWSLISLAAVHAASFLRTDGRLPAETTGWLPPVNISNTAEDSSAPALAALGGTVHIVWQEGDFLYHIRGDGGAWAPPLFVSAGWEPALAAGPQGTTHLVWSNEFGGNFEIYYSRWDGSAWSLPRNVSGTSGVSVSPVIAVADDGTLHVAWADNSSGASSIYHAWSTDGLSWITFPVPFADGMAPALAVDGNGVVHLAWQSLDDWGGHFEVFYSRWDGSDWTLPEAVPSTPGRDSILPAIAAGQRPPVHMAWQAQDGQAQEILHSVRDRLGWSLPEDVSMTGSDSSFPTLSLDRTGRLHLAWDEAGPTPAMLYRSLDPMTEQWSPISTVITSPPGISDPVLYADGHQVVHAAWAQGTEQGTGDVFYSRQQGFATPEPSPSSTATPSSTSTAPPLLSPTATPSATPTVTATATPSATRPTTTAIATPSSTPTVTPSSSPTATATRTPTATSSTTLTATPPPSPTASPTATPTPTATVTSTATSSPTITPRPTNSSTPTPSATATATSERVLLPLLLKESFTIR